MVELNATILIVTMTENALNIPVTNKFHNKKRSVRQENTTVLNAYSSNYCV